jgi:hypothetical protein
MTFKLYTKRKTKYGGKCTFNERRRYKGLMMEGKNKT